MTKFYKAIVQINNEYTYNHKLTNKYPDPVEVVLKDSHVLEGYSLKKEYNRHLKWYGNYAVILSKYSSGNVGFTIIMLKEIEEPE